jgi:uncharacterized NAD(P)/FAD-binding protein YdhS
MGAVRPSIAVIGGGFSGLICAIHLLRKSRQDGPRIYLIEQNRAFGVGAAYATASGRHLLNTRAANMSVFPDDPDHFLNWLRSRPETFALDATSFVTRRTYGDYLQNLLRDAACSERAAGRLYLVPDTATGLTRLGEHYLVSLGVGKDLLVDAVVLATGNPAPHPPTVARSPFFDSMRYISDPWNPGAFHAIEPDDTVLMLGTGLTMVDVALLLRSRGHRGPLVALSRRALMPRRHATPATAPNIVVPSLPPSLSDAVRAIRLAAREAEGRGGTWQHMMDALRPSVSRYWQTLPLEAKRRFLRHLRPWWDVHRHRLAPEVARRLDVLLRKGDLTLCRGRLTGASAETTADGYPASVQWRPAGDTLVYRMGVHHVVNCMGPGGDPTRSRSPLFQSLLASGLARPDVLRLGLDVDAAGRLINQRGEPAARLFALGPPTRGVFWESTAVPDIRQYAAILASSVLAAMSRAPSAVSINAVCAAYRLRNRATSLLLI